MEKPTFLHGKILLKESPSSSNRGSAPNRHILPFDVPRYKPSSFENTLMVNFQRFHFSREEKKELTASIRQNIHIFEHLNVEELSERAQELSDKIMSLKGSHHVVESSGYGSFICLAALFSGNISPKKTLTFHLNESPLALFPKALAPKKGLIWPQYRLTFHLDQDCWFRSISTLSHCPEFLELDFQVVQDFPVQDKVLQRDRKLY